MNAETQEASPDATQFTPAAFLIIVAAVLLMAVAGFQHGGPLPATTLMVGIGLASVPLLVRFSIILEGRDDVLPVSAACSILFGLQITGTNHVGVAWSVVVWLSVIVALGRATGVVQGANEVVAGLVAVHMAGLAGDNVFDLGPVVQVLVMALVHGGVLGVCHHALGTSLRRRPLYLQTPRADLVAVLLGSIATNSIFSFVVISGEQGLDRPVAPIAVYVLLIFVGGQAMLSRRQLLLRGIRTLENAATAMPWPPEEIDDLLRHYASVALRAPVVSIETTAGSTGLRVPLRDGKTLVAHRARGDLPFIPADHRLTLSLVEMSQASRRYAAQEAMLRQEATTDDLTGMRTYASFRKNLVTRVAGRRPGEKLLVVFADLDKFKMLNTTIGHLNADLVLKEIGERLRTRLPAGMSSARFGGDEFVFLTDQVAGSYAIRQVLAKIYDVMTEPVVIDDQIIRVTPSFGAALSSDTTESADDIVQRAELNMRRSKQSERAAPQMQGARKSLVEILEQDQVGVAYQPIIDSQSGALTAIEALLRTEDQIFGALAPPLVVDTASRNQLLDRLTLAVARQALEVGERATAALGHPLTVSLNVQFEQLGVDGSLLPGLRQLTAEHPGVQIMLEVSERTFRPATMVHQEGADVLRSMGIGLAIDDFGAGFATYSLLMAGTWDWVKLDRSLLDPHDPKARRLLTHVSNLMSDLDKTTVMEGIESGEHMDLVARLGFTYAQGHWISAPLDGDGMVGFARSLGDPTGQGPTI